MLRSLYSGISGMKNFQTKLDVIGNNIANVSTVGFKKSRVTFKDAMNQTVSGASAATTNRGGKNGMQVGLGSSLSTIDNIMDGSSLQTTNRPLDLGIDGDGFFIVKQGNSQSYTRAGNFYLDNNGTLVNSDGLKVQAYKYDSAGNLTNNYGDVTVNVNAVLPPKVTKNIAFSGNLAADAINGTVFSQQIKTIDSTGNAQSSTIYFKKNGTTTWDLYSSDPNATPAPTKLTSLTFDATGKNPTDSPSPTSISIPTGTADNPATPGDESIQSLPVTFDFSNLTQQSGASTAQVTPDGNLEGKLDSFNVGSSGEISGVYSNGLITTLGRIALAKFSNPSGLTKEGGNLFQETVNSGTPDIDVAGNGRGTIASGSLEMSNVDLSEEFTEMITAQRGFDANTKIITTSDEILQELVNLKH
ncbi:MAG: flagellar basal-body rod protein FlgF [Bacillota bacterium]|nr:flagellar basal-body rod protein FlgF [Bacillota bacterium]